MHTIVVNNLFSDHLMNKKDILMAKDFFGGQKLSLNNRGVKPKYRINFLNLSIQISIVPNVSYYLRFLKDQYSLISHMFYMPP